MSKRDEIVAALRAKADEFEATGVEQYKRSANQSDMFGYTEFNNARIWGERAQNFRRAAAFIAKEFKK